MAAILLSSHAFAQNQLQFTKTMATGEGAIQLYWQSQSNDIYQVQFLSDLSETNSWQTLVDDYPSQGTNTLWLDTGDYSQTPPVNHPKYDPC